MVLDQGGAECVLEGDSVADWDGAHSLHCVEVLGETDR